MLTNCLLFGLFKDSFELRQCAKWISRKTVVIVRRRDVWTYLLLPISWLVHDKTYRRVVTGNGSVPQVLEDME